MSLGLFKRVALWQKRRKRNQLRKALLELRSVDPLKPYLPLKVADFWRLASPEVFVRVPLDIQISLPLHRQHKTLEQVQHTLERIVQLIDTDDYTYFIRYLADTFELSYSNTLSEYLTTEQGHAIDVEFTFTRINTLLYTLADLLENQQASEYNRGVYLMYKDLFVIVEQLNELELA